VAAVVLSAGSFGWVLWLCWAAGARQLCLRLAAGIYRGEGAAAPADEGRAPATKDSAYDVGNPGRR
jgi:hypothetical protein